MVPDEVWLRGVLDSNGREIEVQSGLADSRRVSISLLQRSLSGHVIQ